MDTPKKKNSPTISTFMNAPKKSNRYMRFTQKDIESLKYCLDFSSTTTKANLPVIKH